MVVPISLTNVVEDAEGVEEFAGRPGSGQAQTPPGVPGNPVSDWSPMWTVPEARTNPVTALMSVVLPRWGR